MQRGLNERFFITENTSLFGGKLDGKRTIIYEIVKINDDGNLIIKPICNTEKYYFETRFHLNDKEATPEKVQRAKESKLASKTK